MKALIFDYGNTLIEFGPRQCEIEFNNLADTLGKTFGPCDREQLAAIRGRQIMAPFTNDLQENDMHAICRELIEGLYAIHPESDQVDALYQTRHDSFLQVVEMPEETRSLLYRLKEKYIIGLISNYPVSSFLHDSFRKLNISDLFESVVISGDLGLVKPHPMLFETIRENLSLPADQCVYVGDNWLADIQGAKRAGMKAIHITQYSPHQHFDPVNNDHHPDATINHILELEEAILKV